ncbi:MAG: ACT domain-containing protein [Firmicutes bacterium]|nr:ACT domain-containing protein [Bacillota bacterium]
MRAIITVIGQDRVGIIAGVSGVLAAAKVNILDISQTVLQEYFTMMMLVEISNASIPLEQLQAQLVEEGNRLGVTIKLQHEDVFKSMHRI